MNFILCYFMCFQPLSHETMSSPSSLRQSTCAVKKYVLILQLTIVNLDRSLFHFEGTLCYLGLRVTTCKAGQLHSVLVVTRGGEYPFYLRVSSSKAGQVNPGLLITYTRELWVFPALLPGVEGISLLPLVEGNLWQGRFS